MRRTLVTALAVVLVVSVVGVPATAAIGQASASLQDGADEQQESATNNSSVAPGERLAGVIGVQEAELEGEVDRRAFGIAVATAATGSGQADVVLEQIDRSRDRLDELRDRKADLKEARENGSISEGEYRARAARLATETENVKELANDTGATAGELPADVLREKGINVSAIRQLSEEADQMTGPDVAAVARSIAGDENGEVVAYERPDAAESIAHAERRVGTARERLRITRERVNETNASDDALEALDEAASELDRAESALAAARTATDTGDDERARELAEDAADAAGDSIDASTDAAQQAREDAREHGGDRDGVDDGDDRDGNGSNDAGGDGDSPSEDDDRTTADGRGGG